MRQIVSQYTVILVIFLVVDALWLSTAGRTIYIQEIGPLLRDRPQLLAAFAFYLIYAAGLMVFAVQPGLQDATVWRSIALGGFLGFVAYATYDMTSLAVLKGFTLRIALIDMIWGSALSAATVWASIWLIRLFKL